MKHFHSFIGIIISRLRKNKITFSEYSEFKISAVVTNVVIYKQSRCSLYYHLNLLTKTRIKIIIWYKVGTTFKYRVLSKLSRLIAHNTY